MLISGYACLLWLAADAAGRMQRFVLRRFIYVLAIIFITAYACVLPSWLLMIAYRFEWLSNSSSQSFLNIVASRLFQIYTYGILTTSPLIGLAMILLARQLRRTGFIPPA